MHCPGCGQQQISNETKFCSRCGMPLGIVSEVVAHGGYLPQLVELNKKKKTVFNKKNGVVFSLFWFLIFSCFLTSFFAILEAPEALVAICAITGFFGGVMTAIASLIFLPSSKLPFSNFYAQQSPPAVAEFTRPQGSLPAGQSIPATVYAAPNAGNWRDTNDLQPTSVTESTTRLLNKDEI